MPVDPQRVARLNKARNSAKELLTKPPARWENECETVFAEFRVSCVHVRKDKETLDAVEDKQAAWRFICKFCRDRPFQQERCNEVLNILMGSEEWMKEFIRDPEADIRDLPPSIAEKFGKRIEEVDPDAAQDDTNSPPGKGDGRRGSHSGKGPGARDPIDGPLTIDLPTRPAGMAVVVQRCEKARVLVNERNDWWGEIGRGLLVSVSFANDATPERVIGAAKFLLTAKLSTAEMPQVGKIQGRTPFGSDAESVIELCKKGHDQGILVMPQASLVSEVGKKDLSVQYDKWCKKDAAQNLYKTFIDTLRKTAQDSASANGGRTANIVASEFNGRQFLELTSAGPFMHSFNF